MDPPINSDLAAHARSEGSEGPCGPRGNGNGRLSRPFGRFLSRSTDVPRLEVLAAQDRSEVG